MTYHIELETRAKKQFLSLPKTIRQQLANVLDELERNPRPPGAKKLTAQNGYRIRKGDYRILYVIDDKQSRLQVYRIGHRREVYR